MSLSWYLPLILRLHLCPDSIQPRGLQIQWRPDQPQEALLQEEEEVKRGIGGPASEQVSKVVDAKRNTSRN
jgi:hypothetical protein